MSNRSYVRVKARLLEEPLVGALAETFKVLGDTTRVRILDALSRSELCVQDVADMLGVTQSAVSHQLRLLRSMRLVRTRREGRQIFYALDDHHIVKLFAQGLEHVEENSRVGARLFQAADRHRSSERSTTRERAARDRGAKRHAPHGGQP
jgi:ArsR family transcriptional regulator, lead/cadmium/zinc/bismuth-responsive transcriptional repressor